LRYYRIVITDPASGIVATPPGFTPGLLGGATYTSFVDGRTLPNAWNVEFDVPVIDAATSQGFSLARVWGISLQEISQARDLVGKNVAIYGGMQKGLPLAKPAQSGLLVSGVIFQAFGNWIGTDQTLDLVISPGPASGSQPGGVGTLAAPRNLTLNWQGGKPLGPVLKSCLETGFPGYAVKVNVNSDLVRPAGDTPTGFYSTLAQLAQDVRGISRSIVKTTGYPGVSIVPTGTAINAFDSPQGDAEVAIAFEDLIGQPTWIESPNIQVKTVMRADLAIGSKIKLPPTLVTNTAQANSALLNQRANFQGGFFVVSVRHVGDFRAPGADAWVSVIEAAPLTVQ
jgi:hypothetical protein